MKCRVLTDVGTWTNWLTFESDPDYCLFRNQIVFSDIEHWYVEFYVGKIPRTRIGGVVFGASRVLKWFYWLSCRITFVGGKCALPSALLVAVVTCSISKYTPFVLLLPAVLEDTTKTYRAVIWPWDVTFQVSNPRFFCTPQLVRPELCDDRIIMMTVLSSVMEHFALESGEDSRPWTLTLCK